MPISQEKVKGIIASLTKLDPTKNTDKFHNVVDSALRYLEYKKIVSQIVAYDRRKERKQDSRTMRPKTAPRNTGLSWGYKSSRYPLERTTIFNQVCPYGFGRRRKIIQKTKSRKVETRENRSLSDNRFAGQKSLS